MSNYSDDADYSSYSLMSFCQRANELYDQDHSKFVRFVLSGMDETEEDGITSTRQVVVDPILNAVVDNQDLSAVRDYDSLLGFSTDIEILCPLTVFPLSRNEDVLTANVHLTYDFVSDLENGLNVPIHKVPNISLGKWGTHTMIRLFFPALYSKERSTVLSQSEQALFYDYGFRPAIEELMGNASCEWPLTYADAMLCQRRRNGWLAFQSKTIPSDVVPHLVSEIRDQLEQNDQDFGYGMVVLHQVRGVKHSYQHPLDAPHPTLSLLEFLRQNDLIEPDSDNFNNLYRQTRNQWWCDVGLEFSSDSTEGYCTQWRTDGHAAIVTMACGISERSAQRITSVGSSHYTRDIASHLPAVSGCRIATGSTTRGPHDVRYLQMYTTDKALLYNPENGHFSKYTTCADALDGTKAITHCKNIHNIYRAAISKNYSAARLEVRVPLREAAVMFSNIDFEDVQPALLSFDSVEWWGFRAYRCLALRWVIEWQSTANADLRMKDSALLLTAATVWLINSIHSTPDIGASSKDLLDAVLPHVSREGADPDILAHGKPTEDSDPRDDDSDDEEQRRRSGRSHPPASLTAPAYPHGIIFLLPIYMGIHHPAPRFALDCKTIKDTTFQYFFKTSRHLIIHSINAALDRLSNHPVRIANKTRSTAIYCPPRSSTPEPILFDLSHTGFELEPRETDIGSDDEMLGGDDDDDAAPFHLPPDADIDDELTFLWRQCLFDVTARSPNMGSHTSGAYCILSRAERNNVNEDTYLDHKLSDYFRDCQWCIADNKNNYWQKVFNYIFPAVDRPLPQGTQNYNQCEYYRMWRKMKARTDESGIKKMREALLERFNTLYWFPQAVSDRIWVTKVEKKVGNKPLIYRKSSGFPANAPSPRIVVNKVAPDW